MNWISKNEFEIILKEYLELIRQEIAKSPGIGTGTGGGGVGTGTGGAKLPITGTDEQKWNQFFKDKGIEESDKNNWKNLSGLTPEEARDAYDKNEWTELSDPKISDLKNNKTISYTEYDYKATGIELLKHPKKGIKEAFEIISSIKKVKKYTELLVDYEDAIIKSKIEAIKTSLPNSLNVDALKKIRDDCFPELFKNDFEGSTPSKVENIDAWRTTDITKCK